MAPNVERASNPWLYTIRLRHAFGSVLGNEEMDGSDGRVPKTRRKEVDREGWTRQLD